MTTGHTPKPPWKVLHYAGAYDIITDDTYDHYAVAEIDERSPNAEANAYLMVAAPETLESLRKCVPSTVSTRDVLEDRLSLMRRALAAIAKARGHA